MYFVGMWVKKIGKGEGSCPRRKETKDSKWWCMKEKKSKNVLSVWSLSTTMWTIMFNSHVCEMLRVGENIKNWTKKQLERMQPKAQMLSMRCHKQGCGNSVTWHSQRHAKWWMPMTRSVQRKCTSLCHLYHKLKWKDKMTNQLARPLDMVSFPCDRLAKFVNEPSHSPYLLYFLH